MKVSIFSVHLDGKPLFALQSWDLGGIYWPKWVQHQETPKRHILV